MKVAILTFHSVPNFGAFLQTFALKSTIESFGHEVQVINLQLGIKKSFIGSISYALNDNSFSKYRAKYLNLTESITSFEGKREFGFDLYVVGSDQVWNKTITKENYLNYFFNFLPDSSNKISYAASFGQKEWPFNEEETNQVKTLLQNFSGISVREKNGQNLIRENLGLDSELVLDPTLLIKNYDQLIDHKQMENNLMTCFKFSRNGDFYDFVRKFSKQEGIKIRELRGVNPFKGTKTEPFPNIGSWLYFIKSAPYVITDSFHGVCFSIIFNKKFIAIPADVKKFNRIENLLSQLGLSNRIFYSYDEILENDRWKEDIDYVQVNNKLDALRKNSLSFLQKWL